MCAVTAGVTLDNGLMVVYSGYGTDRRLGAGMYRDNSLMPKEALRLAALGILLDGGARPYGELASAVRHFTGRIVGPSLDLMGSSLEMLRLEGLIDAVDAVETAAGMDDTVRLAITPAGRQAFETLMRANVRAPSSDGINKLVVALKLRFLHLLLPPAQREQVDGLLGLYEAELARLNDLARHHADDPGLLAAWLKHDIEQVRARLTWFDTVVRQLQG
jgi:DNA-binding PadR family transcriptional regulator